MKTERVFLSSSDALSSTWVNEFRISYPEHRAYLSQHSNELKTLLTWSVIDDQIIFKAKPEAFGIIKFASVTIEVLPKFLGCDEKVPSRFVSDLFNITAGPGLVGQSTAEKEFNESDGSTFDWYFFSLLNQFNSFLRKYDRRIIKSYDEQIIGVRGRLKIADSLRAGKGLSHINICEVQSTEPRIEFLGMIKSVTHIISSLSDHPQVKDNARKCLSNLKDIPAIPFNKSSIKTLRHQSKLIVSEYRKSAAILKSIFGIFNLLETTIGSLSHQCFHFNMNLQFELIVDRVLNLVAVGSNWTLRSGNKTPLKLLNNQCNGFIISESESESGDEFPAESITIKPDVYLTNDDDEVTYTIDSKYKILQFDSNKRKFSGIRSKDVQQVLSYWLHFTNQQSSSLRVGLIYPAPVTIQEGQILKRIGFIDLDNPVREESLKIEIYTLNILKAVKSLVDQEELSIEDFSEIIDAA